MIAFRTAFRTGLIAGAAMGTLGVTPAFAQFGPPVPLEEGEGKEMTEALCTACHATNMIATSTGYTRAQWAVISDGMIDLPASPARDEILDYLAEHYPPNGARAATPADGPLELSFTEWTSPRLGGRPRDPVEAPDGAVWWVGQTDNTIGRLYPATGEAQVWDLPPGALPHSVNIDDDGGVWYLGNGNGTIGKFDPETGAVDAIAMPDPAARDPHTGEFDANGIFWFTLQQSNMLGRLDPATREVRLVTAPRERSRPYGIKVAADGALWIPCNGANCIYRMDPETMEVRTFDLPEGSTVRRLDIASDGVVWYGNSSLGRVGRLDPETGDLREWDSPSGPTSHPYAFAIVNDVIWYNESGVRPDMLVRFDPKTEAFQSWPVPTTGDDGTVAYAGIIRHMRTTADGDLLIHQGATSRILRAHLPPAE